jgi:ribosomal protein L11 methyltransferase
MDPGMAFGTGTHETTRLVIGLLEKYTKEGQRVLDVGCGSGILAICASKLGAKECRAYDIDEVAVRVARENIEINGCNNITCDQSDLLKQVELEGGQYDLVCANIVADIIIRMLPDVGRYMKNDAILLASGIINERADDVMEAFEKFGFEIVEHAIDNGWCAFAIKKK